MGTRNLFADKLKAFGIFFVFVAIFCEILCGQESGSAVDDEKRTVIVFLVASQISRGTERTAWFLRARWLWYTIRSATFPALLRIGVVKNLPLSALEFCYAEPAIVDSCSSRRNLRWTRRLHQQF